MNEETAKQLRVGQKVNWVGGNEEFTGTIVDVKEQGIFVDWGQGQEKDWFYWDEMILLELHKEKCNDETSG